MCNDRMNLQAVIQDKRINQIDKQERVFSMSMIELENEKETTLRDLELRKIALGELAGDKTGFASTEKPWLKYYSEEDISAKLPRMTAFQDLVYENKEHIDDIAFHYYGKEVSYRDLLSNINIVADAFASIGINHGDVVMVSSLTIPEVIYAFYALNKIGAIPDMIDPRTSIEGIHQYCQETNAKCFITLGFLVEKMKNACDGTNIKTLISIDPTNSLKPNSADNKGSVLEDVLIEWNAFLSKGVKGKSGEKDYVPNECCVIVHTGGTTGMAKSVILSDDNLNAAAHLAIHSPLRLRRGDSFLNLMPPFISYGVVIGLHAALIEGWKSIIIPQFELSQFDQLIVNYKPNGIMGVPAYFEILMNSQAIQNMDLSFIKAVLVGGDNISEVFEQRINQFFKDHNCTTHLSKGYSMTEASASGTLSYEIANKYGSAGIPMSKTVISAFDFNTNEELPLGVSGELCLHTPTIMNGYYGNSYETEKVLKLHKDGLLWLHSGDIGYVDNEGFIYIEGRMKRVIIRHDGFKVFPAQIEAAIKKSDHIELCCAIGVPDEEHIQGKKPIVCFTKKDRCKVSDEELIEELRQLCKKELPEYEQPYSIYKIERMPLTSVGKAV